MVLLQDHCDDHVAASPTRSPTGSSRRSPQQADSRLHLATMDAAHNAVLKQVLVDLEASISIGAPAHPWGEPTAMREMELRSLHEHKELVGAIADGRADDAEALARAHVGIDFENIPRRCVARAC